MADCLFCKLRDGDIPATITYRDDDAIAFRDIKPEAPFHELVIPTRHIVNVGEASPEDAAILGKLMLVAGERGRASGYPDAFRVIANSGRGAGQTVFHLHLHVIAGRPLSWPPG